MNDTRPQVVRGYLRELDAALEGVPDPMRRDILDGIAADLAGLDAPAAATRIEQLGDPSAIAAEARTDASDGSTPRPAAVAAASPAASAAVAAASPAASVSAVSPRWYVVVTSLTVAFGGFVVPIAGWVVGIVLMWLSNAWQRWEKWTATLVVVGVPAAVLLIAWLSAVTTRVGAGDTGEVASPIMPFGFSGWHSGILLGMLLPVVVGIWLLWRGLRRG
ncbi:hypothetical protein GCM10025870_12060 [Agromyces marinus]|uniref:DUF1700 domain-containing protein n=2 Tax=Agromyces marinus TaxID=1389020 RepID=A0ABN6YAD7_9MICO|nr:hypothetical protein GCM10025870_12060 [Agromyces marinus]